MKDKICSTVGRQRTLFGLAGTVVLTGTLLAATASTWFLVVPAFVAVNLLAFAAFGGCPVSVLLGRACRAGGAR